MNLGNHTFRHEALMYPGASAFVPAVLSHIEQAVSADWAVLVMVNEAKIAALRDHLGSVGNAVEFADMTQVGANPARIIPAWLVFAEQNQGRAMFGIGEPIWPKRGPDELAESHHHESLINLAFADVKSLWILCSYDISELAAEVIGQVRFTHPLVDDGHGARPSPNYNDSQAGLRPFRDPLPPPPDGYSEFEFAVQSLRSLRQWVLRYVSAAGLDDDRGRDLILAVNEVATNSIAHGGGGGRARIWNKDQVVICEVFDHGHIRDPLVGRKRPAVGTAEGRGIWMANQLCDLVQIRSVADGTVVRMHRSLERPRLSHS